jgi:hypothetical protein
VAYLVGFYHQCFAYTVYGILINTFVMLVLFAPAWPPFKKSSLKWLEPEAVKKD